MAKSENILDLRRFWRAVTQLRWIYVASVVGFLALAVAYWFVALPQYKASGELLVEDSEMGGGAGGMDQMMKTFSIGGFGGAAVDNEMLIMNSHDVAMRVVKNLQLNRTYTARLDGDKQVLWGNSPIAVEAAPGYFDTMRVALKVKVDILDSGKVDVKVTKGLLGRTVGEAEDVELPTTVKTEYGDLTVLKTSEFDNTPYKTVKVSVTSYEIACKLLTKTLFIDVASKLGDAILVEYKAPNRQMGMDVVNAIMAEYNAKRLQRTHSRAAEEVEYYDGAIAKLMTELGDVEKKEADFLSKDGLLATPETASMLAGTAMNNKMADVQARQILDYYQKVLAAMKTDAGGEEFVPVVEGIPDANVTSYNEAVWSKRQLLRSATENNTALVQLNQRIDMLRGLMIESAEKMIAKSKNEIASMDNVTAAATSKLVDVPQKTLEYTSIVRDKTLKNQLYAFLRQSREQSMLQLYSTSTLGFVFEEAYCDLKPDNMTKYLVFVIMLFLGIFCPSCLALWLTLRYRKVKDLMDLAPLSVEANSVEYDGSKAQLNKLRAILVDNPSDNRVYWMSVDGAGASVAPALVESLMAIGRRVVQSAPASDNDTLLSEAWQKDADSELGGCNYLFVQIPNPERAYELAHTIDEQSARLLVFVPSGKVKRSALKAMLAGMPADKVTVCIITK